MDESDLQAVDVIFDRNDVAFGVNDEDEHRLRELSWQLNSLTVTDVCTGLTTEVRYIGGRWIRP